MSAGLDCVPAFLISDCSNALLAPLTLIFNKCIQTSTFPDVWKLARICPVLKSGESSNIRNYRPISILSNFAKIFESVIYSSIYPCVKNLLSVKQHGFIRGRSTISNLTCITQYLSNCLDNNLQVDVIYTDISKAFDRINHINLLCKLHQFGFSTPLLSLFTSYLHDRKLSVVYNNCKSTNYLQSSGVPQGSNLGPLLFLLYVDDITAHISNSHCLLYADDLKLYRVINCEEDCRLLQEDLNRVSRWGDNNDLLLTQINVI